VIVLGGGFLVLGRGGSSSSAAVHQIKPLHPVNKAAKKAAHAATHKVKPAKAHAKPNVALAPPKVAKAPKTQAATDGMPAALSVALKHHAVVVVSLVVPGSTVDDLTEQEAKAGAKKAGAGFVRISTASDADVQALSTLVDSNADAGNRLLDAPAVLVFRKPQELYVRFNGYIDADTVAQAVANAAPTLETQPARNALVDAWVAQANAVCDTLQQQVASTGLPTSQAEVLPWIQKLVAKAHGAVAKLHALRAPKANRARVTAMLSAYDQLLRDVDAELAAAKRHDLATIRRLDASTRAAAAQGDAIAAQLGATSCSGPN